MARRALFISSLVVLGLIIYLLTPRNSSNAVTRKPKGLAASSVPDVANSQMDIASPMGSPTAEARPGQRSKLAWTKIPSSCKLLSGIGITSRSSGTQTYMSVKLDLLAQVQVLGMSNEEGTLLQAAVDRIADIDRRILKLAGITSDDMEDFQYGHIRRTLESHVTSEKLLSLLRDSSSEGFQSVAKDLTNLGVDDSEQAAIAIKTRLLILLSELGETEALSSNLRESLYSRTSEHAAAAALGLSRIGLVDEALLAVRQGPEEVRSAYLSGLKWGCEKHHKDEALKMGFGITGSRFPPTDSYIHFLKDMAESPLPSTRAAAIEALSQSIDRPDVLLILKNSLQTESDTSAQIALFWNRSSYLLALDPASSVRLMELANATPPSRVSIAATIRLGGSRDPQVVASLIERLRLVPTGKDASALLAALQGNGHVLQVQARNAIRTYLASCQDSELHRQGQLALDRLGRD